MDAIFHLILGGKDLHSAPQCYISPGVTPLRFTWFYFYTAMMPNVGRQE